MSVQGSLVQIGDILCYRGIANKQKAWLFSGSGPTSLFVLYILSLYRSVLEDVEVHIVPPKVDPTSKGSTMRF